MLLAVYTHARCAASRVFRWTARLGDEMNGWEAEETLSSFAEAEDWLAKKACEIYPESTFAKKNRPGLNLAVAIQKV